MKYKHLTYNDRCVIDKLFNILEMSYSEIAKILKRNKSTIQREIKRNCNEFGIYEFEEADIKSKRRFKNCHLMRFIKYKEYTKDFLNLFDPKDHGIKTTFHELSKLSYDNCPKSWRTIYNWIKSRRWDLRPIDRLRKYYVKGVKRKIGMFTDINKRYVLPIWTRAKSIDTREEFGHWELDLIIGKTTKNHDHILTLLERKTRMFFTIRINNKKSFHINSKIREIIKNNNLHVKTITTDNGVEFDSIGLLAKWFNIKIYQCEPYASWQKGSNENANGLFRRFFKKGTDFNKIDDKEILNATTRINLMPRPMFEYKSSYELYKEEMKKVELGIN